MDYVEANYNFSVIYFFLKNYFLVHKYDFSFILENKNFKL
jgi:hypothetical protein